MLTCTMLSYNVMTFKFMKTAIALALTRKINSILGSSGLIPCHAHRLVCEIRRLIACVLAKWCSLKNLKQSRLRTPPSFLMHTLKHLGGLASSPGPGNEARISIANV